MKNLFILIAVVLTGFYASAQDVQTAPDPNAPVIIFENETFDFGDIPEGGDAKHDFVFTNTGKEKLIITNVKASCGCTTPFWSQEPVMPGETGKITASYNTVNRPGGFNKAITITSNANPGTQRIFIKGNVTTAPTNDGVPQREPSIVNQLGEE